MSYFACGKLLQLWRAWKYAWDCYSQDGKSHQPLYKKCAMLILEQEAKCKRTKKSESFRFSDYTWYISILAKIRDDWGDTYCNVLHFPFDVLYLCMFQLFLNVNAWYLSDRVQGLDQTRYIERICYSWYWYVLERIRTAQILI